MRIEPDRLDDLELNNLNVLLGTFLFFSPWILGYRAEQTACWNAWASGALVCAVAFAALFYFKTWEEWLNLLLGSWICVSPWLLGFADQSRATGIHVIVGMSVAVVASVELWRLRGRHTGRPFED